VVKSQSGKYSVKPSFHQIIRKYGTINIHLSISFLGQKIIQMKYLFFGLRDATGAATDEIVTWELIRWRRNFSLASTFARTTFIRSAHFQIMVNPGNGS
jgi:hypothetical protein